jgi:hypothetical protein
VPIGRENEMAVAGMTSESIAREIAAYLKARDDVADAEVVEVLGEVVSGTIRTQGGGLFAFAVEPA